MDAKQSQIIAVTKRTDKTYVQNELKDKALSFRERLMQKSEIAKDVLCQPQEPEPVPVSKSKPKTKPTQEDERK